MCVMNESPYVQLKEDVNKVIASNYPGGVITTQLTSFTAPQLTKVCTPSLPMYIMTNACVLQRAIEYTFSFKIHHS